MIELNFKQIIYIIITGIGMLAVMIGGLAFWAGQQPSCWDQNHTEEQAIINCEGVNK